MALAGNPTLAPPTAIPLIQRGSLGQFRLIPPIETFPRVVSFAQTFLGKAILLVTFGCGLRLFTHDLTRLSQIILLLAAISFLPPYRRLVLAISPICLFVSRDMHSPLLLMLKFTAIAIGLFLSWSVRHWPQSWFAKRPAAILLSAFAFLIFVGSAIKGGTFSHHVIWEFIGVASIYIWFIAYSVTDRSSESFTIAPQLMTFRPLWGSTQVPFPKGASYLSQIEARNEEQFAIVQLKGLKLLAWAILLSILLTLWNQFFHVYLGIPTAADALKMSVERTPLPWSSRWASLILAFFESVMDISIIGHKIIACCRMAGFNALRNTYRPLSSRTVAEFFNRYYFYFKELLVTFFFYPAFLRYWKGKPQVRLIFATFSAAFFGNAFYHFTRDWWIIRDLGLKQALITFQVFFFYAFVLASGITVSQLRKRNPKPASFWRGRLLPACSVCLFYSLLNVFARTDRSYPLIEHLRYVAGLFFIRF